MGKAATGGGIYAPSNGRLTLNNCRLIGNLGTNYGGAIYNYAQLTVINSTFSGNTTSGSGGGLYNYSGSVIVTNSTFSGNQANAVNGGGGIAASEVPITLQNSIVANSTSGGNCKGSFAAASANNLATDGTCSPGFTQVTPVQLGLGSLTGSPAYFPLNPGSLALDSGLNPRCPFTDQRGAFRPQDGNGDGTAVCDIGSYEEGPAWPAYLYLPIVNK